jgi:hypothetical protein
MTFRKPLLPLRAVALMGAFVIATGCSGKKPDALPPGFYRHADNPTVYRVATAGTPCAVGNMTQLAVFGAVGSVHVIDPSVRIVPQGAQPVECGWPATYFQVGTSSEIYRVSDLKGCVARRVPPGTKVIKISGRADLEGVVVLESCR